MACTRLADHNWLIAKKQLYGRAENGVVYLRKFTIRGKVATIAIHDDMTLIRLDNGQYCLSAGIDVIDGRPGAIIGEGEARAVLMAWGVSWPETFGDSAENINGAGVL